MTRVVIHEEGIRRLARDPAGRAGQYLARRGENVVAHARLNASGRPGPEVRTGDLLATLHATPVVQDAHGLFVAVGTSVTHDGVAYPRLLELGGVTPSGRPYRYPFLVPSLRTEFRQPVA